MDFMTDEQLIYLWKTGKHHDIDLTREQRERMVDLVLGIKEVRL